RTASALEDVCRIAKPPMTSLVSENGPSVTVILPFLSRTRTPSLLGNRPPVSTSVPSFCDFSTNLPIASISACGGGESRYDSGWRMNVRYFMAPPVWASDHATNEPGPDRHGDFRAASSPLLELAWTRFRFPAALPHEPGARGQAPDMNRVRMRSHASR